MAEAWPRATPGPRSAVTAAPSGRTLLALGLLAAGANLAAGVAGPPSTAVLANAAAMLALVTAAADLPRLRRRAAGAMDGAVFAAALILAALPHRAGAVAALGLLGARCLGLREGAAARGAGLLLLGLFAWGLHGMVLAGLTAPLVLPAEARVVAGLLSAAGLEVRALGNALQRDGETVLLVMRDCSALSLAFPLALATGALSRLARPDEPLGWWRIGLAEALMLLANLLRLAVMAGSERLTVALHGDAARFGFDLAWVGIAALAALPGAAPRRVADVA